MAHFHIPKPLHGWREFAGEVGVIVLGVLIALAAESALESIRWRMKVSDARQELRYEVGHNMAILRDRIRQQPCAARRLKELGLVLTQASTTGNLPPLGAIGAPGHYTWPEAVWETQVAAQTASHFRGDEIASLARIYRLITLLHQLDDTDRAAWLSLSTMTGPGRHVDSVTVDRFIQALVQARLTNDAFSSAAETIQTILGRASLGKDFPQIDPSNPPVLGTNRLLCNHIGGAPDSF
jgi:hypothetical protein